MGQQCPFKIKIMEAILKIKLNDWITGLVVLETIRIDEAKIDWVVETLGKANPDSSVTITWGKDNFIATEPLNMQLESEGLNNRPVSDEKFNQWTEKWYNISIN